MEALEHHVYRLDYPDHSDANGIFYCIVIKNWQGNYGYVAKEPGTFGIQVMEHPMAPHIQFFGSIDAVKQFWNKEFHQLSSERQAQIRERVRSVEVLACRARLIPHTVLYLDGDDDSYREGKQAHSDEVTGVLEALKVLKDYFPNPDIYRR